MTGSGGAPAGAAGTDAVRAANPLTQGSIRRSILLLALPAMGSMVAQTLFGLVDAFWIGRLGAAPLAALGGASFVYWALLAAAETVTVGTAALVAQLVGGGRRGASGRAAGTGVAAALGLGLALAPVGWRLLRPILDLMQLPPDVDVGAAAYLRTLILGLPCIYAFYAVDAVYRGYGNTQTPMRVDFGAVVLNLVLDPLLIFGWGPVPAMGIGGAALATVIAHALGLLVKLARCRANGIRLSRQPLSDALAASRTIARVGLPVAFTGISLCAVFVLLTRIITPLGTAPLAALGVGHRLESVPYFACVGFAGAAAALVGQNLGAMLPQRAELAAWGTVRYCAMIIGAMSLFYLTMPRALVGFFTDDPDVIEHGARYLRAIALAEVFMGIEMVLIGALSGAGDTAVPMVITIVFSAVRVPVAAFLVGTVGMGADGVWAAVAGTVVVRGILMTLWFRTGRWKRRRLTGEPVAVAPDIGPVNP